MHGDLLGILLSVALIAFFLLLSFFIVRHGKKNLGPYRAEVARKVVHIGVSNWFFIYYYVFETSLWPILGLCGFTALNAIMNVSGSFHVIMGQDSKKRNWGLVQYPISVIILIALYSAGIGSKVAVGCGLLGMGYGDGLAALIGRKFGKRKLPGKSDKTVVGFVTMAVVTFIVVFVLRTAYTANSLSANLLAGLACAVCASLVEAFTPFGLDNITVPVCIFFISGLV